MDVRTYVCMYAYKIPTYVCMIYCQSQIVWDQCNCCSVCVQTHMQVTGRENVTAGANAQEERSRE